MDTTLNWHFGSNVWNYSEYEQDFTAKSASVKMPVPVFTGKYDYSVGPDHYKAFRFPAATCQVIQTGYCPYREQPEAFHKAVRKFSKKLKEPTS